MATNETKNLVDFEHPEYAANKAEWNAFRLADLGGEAYARAALRQHPREDLDEFKKREARVMADDFCGRMVDVRLNYLFHEAPKVAVPKGVEVLLEDVDAAGNSFDVIMQRAERAAEVYGTALIVVDKPIIAEPMRTKADALRLGDRPYMVVLPPTQLKNFGQKPDGSLSWALLIQPGTATELTGSDGNFSVATTKAPSYILWKEKEFYHLDNEGKVMGWGENPIGVVPVVPIRYKFIDGCYFGQSLLNSVKSLNDALISVDSMIEELASNQTFSQLVIQGLPVSEKAIDGKGKLVVKHIKLGTQAVLSYSPNTNAPQYISADASQMSTLMDWRERIIEAIHEKANLTRGAARDSGGQQASGISKAYDFLPTNQSLKNQGRLAADGFEYALWLMGQWVEADKDNGAYIVEFPTDFGVQTTTEIVGEIASLNSTLGLTIPSDLNALLLKAYAKVRFPEMTPEDRTRIEGMIDAQVKPGGDFNAGPMVE